MASYDPSISNGTCYYAANKRAVADFIPCGNVALGQDVSCCQGGDRCLVENACYDDDTGMTYLAGCTDKLFRDQSCGSKGSFDEQQWVGLVRCFNANDSSHEEWAGCSEEATGAVAAPNPTCSCDSSSPDALFTAGTALEAMAQLPISTGDHIKWSPGYSPVAISTMDVDSSQISTSLSASRTPTTMQQTSERSRASTPTASSATLLSNPARQELSVGAKAGIGIAAAMGGLALFIAIFLLAHWVRRKRHEYWQKENNSNVTAWLEQKAELPTTSPDPSMSAAYTPDTPNGHQIHDLMSGVTGMNKHESISELSSVGLNSSTSPITVQSGGGSADSPSKNSNGVRNFSRGGNATKIDRGITEDVIHELPG